MLAKILKIITEQPMVMVVAVVLMLLALLGQRTTRRVYQWKIEGRQLEQRTNQFSDLVQPRR